MHFLSALDLNQYTKYPSPYYIIYRGEEIRERRLVRLPKQERDARMRFSNFAERICGFVDSISIVLMEIVHLHLKY